MRKKIDQRPAKPVCASLLLALIGLAGASLAEEPTVSADGWRPKRQPVTADCEAETVLTIPASAKSAFNVPQAVSPDEGSKPFDWRNDLYGPAALPGQAVSENTRDPSLQPHRSATPAVTIRHWCRCEYSSICGHCGLKRPILAVYQDTPMSTAEPRAMLVNSDQLLPPLDRLRLAFERANDRVQETLGRF